MISLANDVVGLFLSDVRTGASTITMQLAKIISFSPEQTFIRKFKEMLLAVKIENALTKEQILELYINIAPLGKHAYGVQAGAHTYYGKPVSELGLAQIAMLAAVSKRPEAGNPINGPEYAVRRRNLVLRRMPRPSIYQPRRVRPGRRSTPSPRWCIGASWTLWRRFLRNGCASSWWSATAPTSMPATKP